jgi:hypothetical protein
MFRVILAFGGESDPESSGRHQQRYSHDIHKLFAELEWPGPFRDESPLRSPVIIYPATAITFKWWRCRVISFPQKKAGST